MVLERRLRDALAELNPGLSAEALGDAVRKLTRPPGSTLEARNRAFHRMLVNGVRSSIGILMDGCAETMFESSTSRAR